MADDDNMDGKTDKTTPSLVGNENDTKQTETVPTPVELQALYDRLRMDLEDTLDHIDRTEAPNFKFMSLHEARNRRAALESLHVDILNSARLLRLEKLSKDNRKVISDLIKPHSDAYYTAIGKFDELIERKSHDTSQSDHVSQFKVKLPDFKLPDFDGSPESWLKWKESFESIIHNNDNVSKVVKYYYLRSAMKFPSGQKSVLENYSYGEDSYDEAWKALCKRYDDPKKTKALLFNRLLSVKRMNGETLQELTRIIDEFSSIVTSLALCEATFDDMLIHIVQYRLDDTTGREWQKEMKNRDDMSFDKMMDFLSDQCSVVASLSSSQQKRTFTKPSEAKQGTARSFNAAAAAVTTSASCVVCQEIHPLYFCPKFKQLSVSERFRSVNQGRLCRNCFSPQHIQRNCTSSHRCRVCKKNHHTLLHSDQLSDSSPETSSSQSRPQSANHRVSNQRPGTPPAVTPFRPPTPPQINYPPQSNFCSTNFHAAEMQSYHVRYESLLATVSIYVLDSNNKWITARALMDSGSQGNHITTSFAKRLGIPLTPSCQTVIGINGQTSIVRNVADVIFASRYRKFAGKLGCLVSDDITGFLPTNRINVKQLELPRDLFLADPLFHQPGKVDLLLGTGVYHDAQLNNIIKKPDMPVLMETEFGWTLAGCFPMSLPVKSTLTCCFTQHAVSRLEQLDAKLEKFLELDGYGEKKLMSPEHQYCLRVYKETTRHDESGKVTVYLPTKEEISNLECNFGNAIRQFLYQEKKRLEDPAFNKAYSDYVTNLIDTGRMSEVSPESKNEGFYLPHHGVKKISSTTTKVRPVFNGSSKSKSGQSLNDCLCVGPSVQPDLFEILLRFREGRFVMKADVEKMYLQVKVDESQRKFQKIVWRNSPDEPIKHFTLNTVTFGLAPSSFLATNTLIFAAEKYCAQFPEASAVIKDSFFVDDFVFSFNDLEKGCKLRDEIRYILMKIQFPMRKWTANDLRLLRDLPIQHLEDDTTETMVLKTLGIVWNSKSDVISFVVKVFDSPPTDKAELLSQIASLFDPKGLVGPVILYAKLIMKKTRNLKWKSKLPEDIQESWETFRTTLTELNNLKIPRHAVITNQVSVALHGFSDASQEAYGAVFYLRSTDAAGHIQVSLLCSKSRVSPPKQQTIARLELCAATLMSRITAKITQALTSKLDQVNLWSDSMITLHWIATEPSKLSVFVGNRVNYIQENTANCQWRHVSSANMPADCLSRGLKPDEIKNCPIWWNGPTFLQRPTSEWPETKLEINCSDEEFTKEVKKTFVSKNTHLFLPLIETRFSSLKKLVNCMAYIRRILFFLSNRGKPLTLEEIDGATKNIVKIVQQIFFPTEYFYLLRKLEDSSYAEKFPSKSPLLQYTPFMDEQRLIRVGGRLQESAQLTAQQKHPMILPHCFFSKLIIRYLHKKFLHPGNSAMLSYVREEYWILKAKSIIRQVKHECLTCFRVNPCDNDSTVYWNCCRLCWTDGSEDKFDT